MDTTTTTILATGPNWVLRRNGDGPAVLEVRNARLDLEMHALGNLAALTISPDLAALIVGTPKHEPDLRY